MIERITWKRRQPIVVSASCKLALLLAALMTSDVAAQAVVDAQEAAAPAAKSLEIVELRVEPDTPRAATLCRLRAVIANRGERPASALRFAVSLEGRAQGVYDKQLFVQTLSPGAETTVKLFNFWTSEEGRPIPEDGVLDLEVTLESARWLLRDVTEDGTENLGLEGAVPNLPASRSVAITIRGVAKPTPSS